MPMGAEEGEKWMERTLFDLAISKTPFSVGFEGENVGSGLWYAVVDDVVWNGLKA